MARITIIGGGLAGLASGLLLSQDGHEVTVLEGDPSAPPGDADEAWAHWQRRGVGQFRQAYALQPQLRRLLEQHQPGIVDDLVGHGALSFDFLVQLEPDLPGRDDALEAGGHDTLTARRPVVELAFARAAERQPGLHVRRGVRVRELLTGSPTRPGIPHVVGVATDDGERLTADLVVDATGRNSRIVERLAEIGARAPSVTQQDNATSYITRYYRSHNGRLPAYAGGALFTQGHSIGLFLLPADNATWCLSIWGLAEDGALRPLREEARFEAVVRSFPDREEWLDGEPISPIMPFVSAGDQTRRFVLDGLPVVTGLLAVGDALAFTEPRLGRGTLTAVMAAVALRDTLAAHADADPVALASAWDESFHRELGPFLRATNTAGQTFAAEIRAEIATGRPAELTGADRGAALNRAFQLAARRDREVGTWLLELADGAILPRDLLGRPGVLERIQELGQGDPSELYAGPSRAELLDLARA